MPDTRKTYRRNKFLIDRNIKIRSEFADLKKNGFKNHEAFTVLADKYFLSENTINSIIYLYKSF